MSLFVNSPFPVVRPLATNAKNLQGILPHGMDKLTPKLSHTSEKLSKMH